MISGRDPGRRRAGANRHRLRQGWLRASARSPCIRRGLRVPRGVADKQPDCPDDFVGRLEAVVRVLREQPPAQLVVPLVQAVAKLGRGGGCTCRILAEDLRRACTAERTPAGHAFEQHGAEGEQVAAAVDRTLLHLLGRQYAGVPMTTPTIVCADARPQPGQTGWYAPAWRGRNRAASGAPTGSRSRSAASGRDARCLAGGPRRGPRRFERRARAPRAPAAARGAARRPAFRLRHIASRCTHGRRGSRRPRARRRYWVVDPGCGLCLVQHALAGVAVVAAG